MTFRMVTCSGELLHVLVCLPLGPEKFTGIRRRYAHCNEESMAIKRVIIFLFGGGSCLQSVKIATSVEHNKVMCNERRYACSFIN